MNVNHSLKGVMLFSMALPGSPGVVTGAVGMVDSLGTLYVLAE